MAAHSLPNWSSHPPFYSSLFLRHSHCSSRLHTNLNSITHPPIHRLTISTLPCSHRLTQLLIPHPHILSHLPTHPLSHTHLSTQINWLTHSLLQLITHQFKHPLTHSLTYPFTYQHNQWFHIPTDSPNQLTHLLTHSVMHSFTITFIHSLAILSHQNNSTTHMQLPTHYPTTHWHTLTPSGPHAILPSFNHSSINTLTHSLIDPSIHHLTHYFPHKPSIALTQSLDRQCYHL